MHNEPRRRRSRRLFLFATACLLGAIVLAPLQSIGAPTASADGLPYTLEVTPTTDLADGDGIAITVRAAPGERLGQSGLVRICRESATYTTITDLHPFQGGHCPDKPVSSSGSLTPWSIRAFPDGSTAVSSMRVGTGTVEWGPATDTDQFTLTCDPTTPCRLVLEIPVEGKGRFIDATTVLTFDDDNPIGSCGGADPAAISTAGPDRLLGAWIEWTRSQCTSTGSQASTQAIFTGEGEGHDAFASGFADLTYSPAGPAFPDEEPEDPRAGVSVPVGLNAAVIGVLGGYGTTAQNWPNGVPRPYENLQVTMAEMATLFGRGPFSFTAFYLDALAARNPELTNADSLNNQGRPNPLGPATADTVTWLTTGAFDTLAGDQWRTPPMDIQGNPPDVPRGQHSSLAMADPPFVSALFELYSAQSQLKKTVAENEFKPFNYGPIWVLTDLATAEQLGIPTVALQNSNGEFVQPTAASLTAAVPALERQADGSFARTGRTDPAGAYPLTFVEQAVAPAEPLLDAACTPRAESQALLEDWLAYLTGPGQAVLPAGLAPLTPALADEAQAALAEVGAATPTGACAPEVPEEPPVDPGETPLPPELPSSRSGPGAIPSGLVPGGPVGSGPSGSGPGGSGGPGSGSGATGDDGGSDGTDEEGGEEELAGGVAQIDVPEPTSGSSTGALAGSGALLGLAVLGGVGGMISSGRPVRIPGRRQP